MQKRKILKNIVAAGFTQVVQFVSNFVLPPLIVSGYGSDINGLVSTAKQLTGYANLVGVGISAASIQSLYKPLAKDDKKEISAIYNGMNKMFAKAGWLFTMITFMMAFIYPLFTDKEVNYWVISLLIIVTSISGISEFFAVSKYRTILFAAQKEYIISWTTTISIIFGVILSYLCIRGHLTIILVQLAYSVLYISRIFILQYFVRKYFSFLNPDVLPKDEIKSKRNNALIHQLAGLLTLGSQVVILSVFVSLDAASIYAIYNIAFSGLQSIFQHINNSFTPFIGKTLAEENIDKLRKEFKYVEFIFSSAFVVVITCCFLLLYSFISLYMKNADITYANHILCILFVVFACCNLSRLPGQMLINAAGHFKETRNRALIEAGLCVGLQLLFAPFFGIIGVLVASIIALGWRCLDIIFYSAIHILNQHFSYCIPYLLKIILIPTAITLVASPYIANSVISEYLQLIEDAFIIGFISFMCCIAYDTFFYKSQIRSVLSKIKINQHKK